MKRYSSHKDVQAVVSVLVAGGWEWSWTGKHPRVTHPSGAFVSYSFSPRGHHAGDAILRDVAVINRANAAQQQEQATC